MTEATTQQFKEFAEATLKMYNLMKSNAKSHNCSGRARSASACLKFYFMLLPPGAYI